MRHDLHDWIRRIRSIEIDHTSTRRALDRMLVEARSDPAILGEDLKLGDIVNASGRLELTYIIRMFAEFETGLRLFWATIRDTEPPTQRLIDGITARRGIPPDRLEGAHSVRAYRNALVHGDEEAIVPIPIAEVRGYLCRFFAFLPPTF